MFPENEKQNPKRTIENSVEKEPTPETKQPQIVLKETKLKVRVLKSVPFWKKVWSFIVLIAIIAGFEVVGQVTLGIPDELVVQVLTVMLYNWFANNGYEIPKWLKK